MKNLRNASTGKNQFHANLEYIRSNMAYAMIGRAVDLLVGAHKTARGIVTGVDMQAGTPKIVVAGFRYDLRQVLTVTPPALN